MVLERGIHFALMALQFLLFVDDFNDGSDGGVLVH